MTFNGGHTNSISLPISYTSVNIYLVFRSRDDVSTECEHVTLYIESV